MLPVRAELLWVTKMLVSTFLPGTAAVSAEVPALQPCKCLAP